MPLNTDPDALPDDVYWGDYEQHAAAHPMTGPSPDQYELDEAAARLDAAGIPDHAPWDQK